MTPLTNPIEPLRDCPHCNARYPANRFNCPQCGEPAPLRRVKTLQARFILFFIIVLLFCLFMMWWLPPDWSQLGSN